MREYGAGHRNNPAASFVNSSTARAQVAFAWRNGSFFGRAGLDGYVGDRDSHYNEKYGGANIKLGRRFGDGWDISANIRYGAQRYAGAIDILDVNRLLYYICLRHRVIRGASVRLDLIGGSDAEQEGGSPYGNSKSGGRFSFSAPIGDKVRASASVGVLDTDYDGLFFGVRREDTQITATLQLEFRDVLSAGFTIIPRVLHVDNDSDVSLYQYERTEVGVLIRWSYK